MLSAIGSSIYASPAGTGPSVVGLQAQLDRYQKELSDCTNCSSAKTLEGRQSIQTLSNQIGEIKARIEAVTITKLATPNARISVGITANLGSILNVFA
jgi:hypothetical protein